MRKHQLFLSFESKRSGDYGNGQGIATLGNLGNHWPGFESLEFRKVYRFYKELDYFTLDLRLDWKGFNTRIAVRFPTRIDPDESHAVYEIPFGTLERAPYWEVPPEGEKKLHGLYAYGSPQAGGNWPALNFVDYSDCEGALAVANTGTPGHHIAGRDITVSLIRSGTATRDGY
ncbi:MAG: hypothetical protein EOM68_21015, partial [Spirochaetia bacterium]|nr:hypothetical protein [Spirochaetia bacterium]